MIPHSKKTKITSDQFTSAILNDFNSYNTILLHYLIHISWLNWSSSSRPILEMSNYAPLKVTKELHRLHFFFSQATRKSQRSLDNKSINRSLLLYMHTSIYSFNWGKSNGRIEICFAFIDQNKYIAISVVDKIYNPYTHWTHFFLEHVWIVIKNFLWTQKNLHKHTCKSTWICIKYIASINKNNYAQLNFSRIDGWI